jgi:quercetin dioxygenase-like cupin family protein
MSKPIQINDLPGSERSRKFEGREHESTTSFFVSRHAPGEGPDLHRHPYEETFIMLEGTASFTVDGETVEAHAGQIVVVPAGAAHGFVNSGEGRLLQVSVHPADHMTQENLA